MKRIRILIPATLLLLFFFGGWTLRNKLAADRQGKWVRVTRGDLSAGVEVSGTLAAVSSETLGPPQIPDMWDFKIAMMAAEGTDVKKGSPVLAFDTTEQQRLLDKKRAEAEQARKQIEKRRADLALSREDDKLKLAEASAQMRRAALKLDAPADIVGVKDRKIVELDYAVSKREVAELQQRIDSLEQAAAAEIRLLESRQHQAEAVVSTAESAIHQMTIAAPRDGTIVYVLDWRGEKKKVGDTVWKALRVIEIPDLKKMKANGEVDEADAGKISVGQRVVFRLDAHPDEEIHGTIVSAGRTVQQQSGTKNPIKVLKVEIAVDRTDPAKMRPGMRFQGTIELARSRNVILIPRKAVFISDKGPVAYRRGLFSVTTVPLKLGHENEQFVEVERGLAPADRVLVEKVEEKGDAKS